MKIAAKLEDVVRTTGVTLLLALFTSAVILGNARYDTGLRGFGHGALSAVCSLLVVWSAVAVVTAALRWRTIRKGFWLVFIVNIGVVAKLVTELLSNT